MAECIVGDQGSCAGGEPWREAHLDEDRVDRLRELRMYEADRRGVSGALGFPTIPDRSEGQLMGNPTDWAWRNPPDNKLNISQLTHPNRSR